MPKRFVSESWISYLHGFFSDFKAYIEKTKDENLKEVNEFKYYRLAYEASFRCPHESSYYSYFGFPNTTMTKEYNCLVDNYYNRIQEGITYLNENEDKIIDRISALPCEEFKICIEIDGYNTVIHLTETNFLKVGDTNGFVE